MNEFEKRRDVPVRYNRGLWVKTIQSMKKVEEIKQKRQKRLWVKRMAASKEKQKEQLEIELQKDLKLVSDETLKQKLIVNREKADEKKKARAKVKPALMEIEGSQ